MLVAVGGCDEPWSSLPPPSRAACRCRAHSSCACVCSRFSTTTMFTSSFSSVLSDDAHGRAAPSSSSSSSGTGSQSAEAAEAGRATSPSRACRCFTC
jgi:hypothetical protein